MPSSTEEIKARLDIIDLIREYVPLAQGGANWKACCPFHDEKPPSFMVSQSKQIWHCFGCAEGGDHFSFIMKIENMDFPEALQFLAAKTGVELHTDPNARVLQSQRARVRKILESAQQWYRDQLMAPAGERALQYLTVARSLKEQTIEAFGMGYAPSGWDGLSALLRLDGYADEDIIASGLVVERQGRSAVARGSGFYDRFRNRVMFPVRDAQGSMVGFGGRLLEDPQPTMPTRAVVEEPKYLNTPQTVVYDKRSILYGFDRAKAAIRANGSVILTEGYMDAIASHQVGVENAVATCGTALTREHLLFLKRSTDTIILSFDMDNAGIEASKRGIELVLASGLKLGMIRIPEGMGKDVDECARKDPGAWKSLAAQFRPFLEVVWVELTEKADCSQLTTQERVGGEFLPYLAKVTSPIERSYWVKRVAESFGYPVETIEGWVRSPSKARVFNLQKSALSTRAPSLDIDQAFVGLLLLSGDADARLVQMVEPAMIDHEGCRLWLAKRVEAGAGKVLLHEELLGAGYTHIVTACEALYSSLEEHEYPGEIERLARAIRTRYFQRELARIQQTLKTTEKTSNEAAMNELLSEAQEITRKLNEY